MKFFEFLKQPASKNNIAYSNNPDFKYNRLYRFAYAPFPKRLSVVALALVLGSPLFQVSEAADFWEINGESTEEFVSFVYPSSDKELILDWVKINQYVLEDSYAQYVLGKDSNTITIGSFSSENDFVAVMVGGTDTGIVQNAQWLNTTDSGVLNILAKDSVYIKSSGIGIQTQGFSNAVQTLQDQPILKSFIIRAGVDETGALIGGQELPGIAFSIGNLRNKAMENRIEASEIALYAKTIAVDYTRGYGNSEFRGNNITLESGKEDTSFSGFHSTININEASSSGIQPAIAEPGKLFFVADNNLTVEQKSRLDSWQALAIKSIGTRVDIGLHGKNNVTINGNIWLQNEVTHLSGETVEIVGNAVSDGSDTKHPDNHNLFASLVVSSANTRRGSQSYTATLYIGESDETAEAFNTQNVTIRTNATTAVVAGALSIKPFTSYQAGHIKGNIAGKLYIASGDLYFHTDKSNVFAERATNKNRTFEAAITVSSEGSLFDFSAGSVHVDASKGNAGVSLLDNASQLRMETENLLKIESKNQAILGQGKSTSQLSLTSKNQDLELISYSPRLVTLNGLDTEIKAPNGTIVFESKSLESIPKENLAVYDSYGSGFTATPSLITVLEKYPTSLTSGKAEFAIVSVEARNIKIISANADSLISVEHWSPDVKQRPDDKKFTINYPTKTKSESEGRPGERLFRAAIDNPEFDGNKVTIRAEKLLEAKAKESGILFTTRGRGNSLTISAGIGDLKGALYAEDEAEFSLLLAGGKFEGFTERKGGGFYSYITGAYGKGYNWNDLEPMGLGQITLSLNTAIWYVTKDSDLSSLELVNGGHLNHVRYDKEGKLISDSWQIVTTDKLNSIEQQRRISTSAGALKGGVLSVKVDFLPRDVDGLGDTDKLVVTQTANGSHKINVVPINTENYSEENTPIERSDYIVRDASGNSEWSLNTSTGKTIDVGNLMYVYSLQSETNPENGSKDWYLAHSDTYSPAAESVLALAGMGAQQTTYLAGLTDLRKRLGEVRLDAQDGLWVQVAGDKSRLSGLGDTRFKQTQYRFNVGVDHKHENWLYGLNFKYSNGNQKTYNSLYRAKGDAHSWGFNLYGTWFNDKGCYLDLVATIDKYHTRLNTNSLIGQPIKGSFRNLGLGVSVETGRKIVYGEEKDFFVEPQLQLSYYHVKGDKFSLSNGMKVQQENFNSLTGRLGVVVGKDWYEANNEKKGQLYAKAGVKQGFMGNQRIKINNKDFKDSFSGTRVYYGLGGDWQVKKNLKFYAQLEREHGKHYTKEIEASLGLKYSF